MSIEIRPALAADKASWNQYVQHHTQATPYHNFAWIESVEQAYGHQNSSQIAMIDGKIVGILPVIKMQPPLSGHFYCSLPYCDIGHILADNEEITATLLEKLQCMKSDSGARKIEYRDVDSPTDPNITTEHLQGKKVSMLLTLPKTSELLSKGFKSKLRSQIRKSEKNGLTYKIGNNAKLLETFYQVFIYNMRKLGSPVHSKQWFDTIRKNYDENIVISIVYIHNTPIGGGIVLRNSNKACIPWASTLAEYNRLAPNMLLYWSLLKEVTDNGAKEFDFGRSTYGEGTFKFKQQWGAQPRALNWHLPGEQHTLSEAPAELGKLRKLVEQTWSKLPVGITVFMGPRIRKHISL